MDGILLIDKPKDWTSFDVVNKVRYIVSKSDLNVSAKKRFPVGHTGTLDPLATGLLVLVLGSYTKQAMKLTKLDKTYETTMKLGESSTTGDEEGEKIPGSAEVPTLKDIEVGINSFVGDILQIPPSYSAIKIGGQRAYNLARKGQEVKIAPRRVTIFTATHLEYEYPFVNFTVEVSSGTYIRTLVEDIGQKLGTGAYMSDLRRTRVGQYEIKDAIGMDGLSAQIIYKNLQNP